MSESDDSWRRDRRDFDAPDGSATGVRSARGDDRDGEPGDIVAAGGEPGSEGVGWPFRSVEARRRTVVRLAVLAGGVLALSVGIGVLAPDLSRPALLRSRLSALGAFAPLAFVTLQAVQVILAPVPGQILGGVGGYLFGTVAGTVYSVTGVVVGSTIAFAASRRFGRPDGETVLDPSALERWDDVVDGNVVVVLFALFLLPTFPDDLLCFVAGISAIRYRTFLALVVVGRTPSFFAATFAGTSLATDRVVAFATVLALALAVSLLAYHGREWIVTALEKADG